MRNRTRFFVFALVTLVAGSLVGTQPVLLPGFSVETVASGLTLPVGFAELPDGRILIAEKSGLVRLFKNGFIEPTPFIDLRSQINDYWDRGLLGLAADANFPSNGYVYLFYVYENNPADYTGPKTSRLTRVTASGDTALPGTEVVVLGSVSGAGCVSATSDCIPAEEVSHLGGTIRVASDGSLYVSTGDGASFNFVDDVALRAQDPDSLAGKLLHVTTTGLGLPSNQWWTGDASANRSKVAALGFRNPFRFSLRPGTDTPYIGDVGWGAWEEVNVGFGNFGWPCYEGTGQQSGYASRPACQALYAQGPSAVVSPVLEYPHGAQSSAVVGGAFYTGTSYPSAYQGAYFFGDYALSTLRYFQVDGNDQVVGTDALFVTDADAPVDLQMGLDGSLYYLSISVGELRRITYSPSQIPTESFISDYSWKTATNGWGPVERDQSNGENGPADGNTLTLNGTTYAKGLGVHAPSDIRYELGGLCTTFTSDIGVDDEVGANGSVVFQVWADGVKLYDSGTMTGTTPTLQVSVDLSGRQELALVVTGAGDGINADHADWADARITCATSPGLFAAPASLPAGTNTHSVQLVDLNNDQVLDVAAANAGSSTASVWLGNGDGTFGPRADYATGLTPKSLSVGDLNNDGLLDLVSADQDAATVSVLLGAGTGAFGAPTGFSVCIGTHETALGDFDEDGNLDLIAACWGGSLVTVLLGRGDGTFDPGVNYPTGDSPNSVVVGDFDLDSHLDAAVAGNGSAAVSVLRGVGDGTFLPEVRYGVGSGPHSIRAGDIDGDGALDLVTADQDVDGFSFLRGLGNGTFAPSTFHPTGKTPKGIAVADVDGDGLMDVLTANTAGSYPVCCQPGGDTISVHLGVGDGTFTGMAPVPVGQTPFSVAAGDIDGDGDQDVATANWHSHDVTVLVNVGSGSPPPSQDTIHVSDLTWLSETNGWGPIERDRSNGENGAGDGDTITLNGTSYLKGIGTHAASDLRLAIPPQCTTFRATVGVDDEVGSNGSVTFNVSADSVSLYQSATLLGSSPSANVDVDVSGRSELRLVVGDGGNGIGSDHADWADARFTGCSGVTQNQAPTMTINNPTGGVPFKVGDVINFDGFADDPEDGILSGSSVSWQIVVHHCVGASCHEHFLATGTGLIGSFVAPDHADDFQLEVRMTATDSNNLTDVASVMLFPQLVNVTLSTSPSGLQVIFNGTTTQAPTTYPVVVGAVRTISTISPQAGSVFQSWSDGGALQHQINVGPSAATYVATFTDTTPPVISGIAATGITSTTATIGWTTNEAADRQVEYGLTTAYGTTTPLQATLATTHSVSLGGLTASTLYHYRVRSRDAAGNLATSPDQTFTTGAAGGGTATRYVSDLAWVSSTNGWGPIERDRSNGENGAGDGGVLTLNGTTYAKGLGAHALSDLRVAIPAGCTAFVAAVGVDDEVGANGSVTFAVSADGVSLFQSATLTGSSATVAVNVSVSGRAELRLVVGNGGNGISSDHADWADARFTGCSGAPDTTPPVISGIAATGITSTTATIGWTTNEAADRQVEYGLTTAYGTTTPLQATLATTHSVSLGGLTASTLYHYRVRSRDAAGNLATSPDQTFTTGAAGGGTATRYVSDLAWVSSTNGWGPIERDRSNGENGAGDGGVLTLNGTTYAKGLGAHALSDLRVAIPAGCTAFVAAVGVDDEVGANGSVTFAVSADGVSLFQSATLTGSSATVAVNVSVSGRAELRLVVGNGGNGISSDHADWADARFTGCSGAPDTTPPVISGIAATGITSTTATIGWTTNEAADRQVEYGLTTAYGTTTPLQATLATTHSVSLGGLTASTLYHYRVRSRDAAGNLATSPDQTFTTGAAGGGTATRYVSDLAWVSSTNGWGPIERDRSNGENGAGDGGVLTLNGTTYAKGLGAHALSDLRVAIPAGCTAFVAAVGVDDEVGANGSVTFAVSADGVSLFQSATLTGSSATVAVNVSVSGRAELRLVVGNGGNGISSDHADWADARFTGCD